MILNLQKTMKDRVFIKDGQIVKHINNEHYKLVVDFKKKQEQELEAFILNLGRYQNDSTT